MDSLKINLKREIDESYDIVFGRNLFLQIAKELQGRCAIITDSHIKSLYGDALKTALEAEGVYAQLFVFEAGEKSKNIDTCMDIIRQMSSMKFGRDTVVVALGGGVVGDTAGFIASIFNRGVPYIQIPTTIVAQADSAIGGKTGVNTAHGKNLVGVIKQPIKVYVDIAILESLPDKELRNGLAETIKHGVIGDAGFFRYLEEHADRLLQKDPDALLYIAQQNARIKGQVVMKDPHEKGLRRIVNYGHTIGHALEKLSNYTLAHGDAISIGMMVAGRIAIALGYFSEEELERQKMLLQKMGLPVVLQEEFSDEAIIEATATDKKAKDGRARYVLPVSIGEIHSFDGDFATYVDNEIVIKAIQQTR